MELKIKKCKIGSSYYDVEYVDKLKGESGQDLSGRIFQATRSIKIMSESYQSQLQTLLHECVHGLLWEYGIKDMEDMVEPLSNGFYGLLIDNPKYIQKILDYTKELKK